MMEYIQISITGKWLLQNANLYTYLFLTFPIHNRTDYGYETLKWSLTIILKYFMSNFKTSNRVGLA